MKIVLHLDSSLIGKFIPIILSFVQEKVDEEIHIAEGKAPRFGAGKALKDAVK